MELHSAASIHTQFVDVILLQALSEISVTPGLTSEDLKSPKDKESERNRPACRDIPEPTQAAQKTATTLAASVPPV